MQQKMMFLCTCGFEEDIETRDIILSHITTCGAYQKSSPLCKFVNNYPLDKLNIQQLLTFRADLSLQISNIDAVLTQKSYILPFEGSIRDYANFASSNQKSSKVSTHNYQNGLQVNQNSELRQDQIPETYKLEPNKPKPRLLEQIRTQTMQTKKQLPSDDPQYDFQSFNQKIQEEFNTTLCLDFEEEQDLIPCESCRKKFSPVVDTQRLWYVEECTHLICRACLSDLIQKEYLLKEGKIICPEFACKCKLTQYDVVSVMGKDKADDLEKRLMMKLNNMVSCLKCKTDFIFEQCDKQEIIKDKQGKILTGEQLKCFSQNRYVCQSCTTEQCRTCVCTPFHLGLTCEDYTSNKKLQSCRLCENPVQFIDTNLPLPLQNICQQEDCQTRSKLFCLKSNQCGHFCQGVKDEIECLPCLNSQCTKQSADQKQQEDDYCNICFTEALRSAPCVRSLCGHIFHNECVLKTLETRWNGPRMNYNFCNCPLCKKWLKFPQHHKALNNLLEKYQASFKEIMEQSRERLKIEGKQNDKELTDPKSPYFNKSDEYAVAVFCFYECFKCKNPYFGGIKNCQANLENDRRNFNQEDLICPECCPITFENKCKKHGNKFIEFKCRFCCSLALWFCGGSVHYCDPCHSGTNGEKMGKPCKGPEYCPLGIAHAENGNECALGCALCREGKIGKKK